MMGIEFVQDAASKQPFSPELRFSRLICDEALKRGLILYPCQGSVDGIAGDMVLIAPPLVVNKAELDEMIEILQEALEASQLKLGI
jgi:adenosylmethionine-8-amino-7-oxononanoate aminotransferase